MSGRAEVIVRRNASLGWLSLNRPGAVGALTTHMCQAMSETLLVWGEASEVGTILIDHGGERGFCAGGDIRMLAESAAGDGVGALRFLRTEYRLSHLISTYPKPVVTVMDGVTMGGGIGISLPADYRIATERTRLAMPETGIGLFPDVGAGWFLPRLGAAGAWLAYTGARLGPLECLALGLATHFVPASNLVGLKSALAEMPAAEAVAKYERQQIPSDHGIDCGLVNRYFGEPTLCGILDNLRSDGLAPWSKDQLAAIRQKSPTSLRVTERLLRLGKHLDTLGEHIAVEYRVAARLVLRRDFREGVRAAIVDPHNAPTWSPASLREVSEALVDELFAPLPAEQEWTPLALEGR